MSCKFKLFKDLWRSRCCLKDIEGFDHSVVNSTLGACGELPPDQDGPCLTYSIWQCGENNVNNLSFLYEEETQPCFVVLGFIFLTSVVLCHAFQKLSNVVSIMEYNFLTLMSPCSGTAQVLIFITI